MTQRIIILALVLYILLTSTGIANAQSINSDRQASSVPSFLREKEGEWDDRFSLDIDGEVNGMIANGNELYITGTFNQVNGVPARGLARWDGSQWYGMDHGSTTQTNLMAVDSSGNLYTYLSGGYPSSIWKYTRTSGLWTKLGADIYGYVFSMACIDSTLYIGGGFRFDTPEYHHFAAWNGTEWQVLDHGLDISRNSYVQMLITNGKQLLAAGSFYLNGRPSVARVTTWDGEQWSALGSEFPKLFPQDQLSIAVLGGQPIILGVNYIPRMINLAGYDSSSDRWVPLDSIHTVGLEYSAAVIGDSLYIACKNLDVAGGADVAIYDPSSHTWSPLIRHIDNGVIRRMAKFQERVVIGGEFTMGGITNLARWNGSKLERLTTSEGYGRRGKLVQLAIFNGDIYALGDTDQFSTTSSYGLVRWDGAQWQKGEIVGGRIDAMASDSTGVYFGVSTAQSRRDIVWNHDTSRTYLGLNVAGTITTILPDGDNLYVGGSLSNFATSTPSTIFGLACWNRLRNEWTFLDSSIRRSNSQAAEVRAVAVFGKNVVVGGSFDSINGIAAKNVARWDGTRWHPIGDGFSSRVLSLAFTPSGELYAGGEFLTSGSRQIAFLASSNGNDWDAVSGSPDWPVHALAATSDELFIGGESFGLMHLDLKTGAWSKPGGGISSIGPLDAIVRAIAMDGDDLYLCGSFSMAGDKLSYNFAHWSPKTSSVGMATTPAAAASFTGIMPNPARGTMTIHFTLPHSGDAVLTIHSALGEQIAVAASGQFSAGEHEVQWDTNGLADGIYFCQLRFAGRVVTERIVMMR